METYEPMDEPEQRPGKYESQLNEKPPRSLLGEAHPYTKAVVVLCFLIVFYTTTPLALGVCVVLFAILCLMTAANPLRDPLTLALIVCGAAGGAIMYLASKAVGPIVLRDMAWPMALWAGRLGVLGASALVLFKWVSKQQALQIATSINPSWAAALMPMFYHNQDRLKDHVGSIRVALRSRGIRSLPELIWYGLSSLLAVVFGETHQLQKRLIQNGLLAKTYKPYRPARWRSVDTALCISMALFVPLIVLLEREGV